MIIQESDRESVSFYLRAALEWIDAIPKEIADALPVMPGFDRDAAEDAMTAASDLAAENKRLLVENAELVNALRAVYTSIRDDRFQQFHDVRRLADTMGIYHEDLDGVRVVAQVVERALAKHYEQYIGAKTDDRR